jgi:hypothetical protein
MNSGLLLFCLSFETGSNLNNILPVARLAAARGLLGGIIYDRPDRTFLEKEFPGTPLISSRELFGSASLGQRIRSLFRGIFCVWKLGLSFGNSRPLLRKSLLTMPWRWVQRASCASIYGVAFTELFRRCRPSFLLSTSDYFPFDSQFFEAGRGLGIKGAVVQHGITDTFWWPFTGDYLFLWGEGARNEMLAMGAPSQRLAVCGMVAADPLFADSGVRKIPNFSSDHAIRMLILSTAHERSQKPELYRHFAKFMVELVAAAPALCWTVKLHPAEDESFYQSLGETTYQSLHILPRGTSLTEALAGSDIVGTIYSTAGLEAMIMNRPLIVFDIHPTVARFAWWPQRGGGTSCPTVEATVQEIRALGEREKYKIERLGQQEEFLEHYFKNQGRAAQAVLGEALERALPPPNKVAQ